MNYGNKIKEGKLTSITNGLKCNKLKVLIFFQKVLLKNLLHLFFYVSKIKYITDGDKESEDIMVMGVLFFPFQTVMLKKSLGCKEVKPVSPKGNQL